MASPSDSNLIRGCIRRLDDERDDLLAVAGHVTGMRGYRRRCGDIVTADGEVLSALTAVGMDFRVAGNSQGCAVTVRFRQAAKRRFRTGEEVNCGFSALDAGQVIKGILSAFGKPVVDLKTEAGVGGHALEFVAIWHAFAFSIERVVLVNGA